MISRHIELICRLFSAAEKIRLPLWLQGGWAIDARLHRVTRAHEDIDTAFPLERKSAFLPLLESLGGKVTEETDYGVLATSDNTLIDCESCIRVGECYELEGLPQGTCPWEKQGSILGQAIRCTSWQAVLWGACCRGRRREG
jgi:2''-aminoglycoside nucleotidyltransferase